ncbi:MAG TPA: site-specific integrase [Candidatus Acetothermia bacterium]|nr:site-specific integrase [Candidatus Acetothermia bacterium]
MATIDSRKNTSGKITYRARVRVFGAPDRTATFDRKTDATRWAQGIESDIRRGRHVPTNDAMRRTVADLIDEYINNHLPDKKRNRDAPTHRARLLWWREQIGQYALANITPSIIAEHRDQLRRGKTPRGTQRSPATVNRYLANLSIIFTHAVKELRWIESNPVRQVSKLDEPDGRVRFLSDNERLQLLEACRDSDNKDLYLIVILALSSGMRKGEIMSLTWRQVDLKNRTIRLTNTKNNDARNIPVAGQALELLKQKAKVRNLQSALLFPSPRKPGHPFVLGRAWYPAIKASKIEDFRFHDLRHSAASYLAMTGATPSEIAAVLGHRTLSMVSRYAHIADEHSAKVVARMNDAFLSLD